MWLTHVTVNIVQIPMTSFVESPSICAPIYVPAHYRKAQTARSAMLLALVPVKKAFACQTPVTTKATHVTAAMHRCVLVGILVRNDKLVSPVLLIRATAKWIFLLAITPVMPTTTYANADQMLTDNPAPPARVIAAPVKRVFAQQPRVQQPQLQQPQHSR